MARPGVCSEAYQSVYATSGVVLFQLRPTFPFFPSLYTAPLPSTMHDPSEFPD
jgi:hypothetical protein